MIGKPIATISGMTFRAMEIAASELAARGMNAADYTIVVDQVDARIASEVTGVECPSLLVSFLHPERQTGQLGGPGFFVALDPSTLKVTAAHFLK